MARKKNGKPESNIITLMNKQPGSLSDEDLLDGDDFYDEDDEVDEEMISQMMTSLLSGMLGGGMTNEQYKGMLLDSLQPWKEVLQMAQDGDTQRIIQKAKTQISLINKKLRY